MVRTQKELESELNDALYTINWCHEAEQAAAKKGFDTAEIVIRRCIMQERAATLAWVLGGEKPKGR